MAGRTHGKSAPNHPASRLLLVTRRLRGHHDRVKDDLPYRHWMRKLEGPDDPARKLPRMFLRLVPPALILLLLVILLLNLISHHRQQPEQAVPAWASALPLHPLRLGPLELAELPVASRFDRPLGNANGALAHLAKPFDRHSLPGQHWSGIGRGDPDRGDPVHSVADGRVVFAGEPEPGRGGVIMIAHRVRALPDAHVPPPGDAAEPQPGSATGDRLIISYYGQLDQQRAIAGQRVHRGQVIGTVGTAGDRDPARLHFELRRGRSLIVGPADADNDLHRIDPEPFFHAHRGAAAELLTPAPGLVERLPDVLIQVQADDPPTADDQDPDITP